MGQKDPLTEWQREGFEMFGSMMKGIAQDFVRYVMHVQVVRQDQAQQQPAAPQQAAPQQQVASAPAARPAAVASAPAVGSVSNLQQTSSDTARVDGFVAAAAAAPAAEREMVEATSRTSAPAAGAGRRAERRQQQVPKQETVVKDEWSKTPRNAPCPCGSGKKFKLCHGAS
jgi:preprotein translocase subunit SecA